MELTLRVWRLTLTFAWWRERPFDVLAEIDRRFEERRVRPLWMK